MGILQDSIHIAQPALATDSQRVFGTENLIRNPVRRTVPLHVDSSQHFGPGLSVTKDSLADSGTLQLFTSPIVPQHPTSKFLDLYQGHELKVKNTGPVLRKDISPDWLFPILILVVLVFTWLRIFYQKYFSQMIQAVLNNNLTNQIVRDENILVQRASVFLSIAFHLTGALFLYLVSIYLGWGVGGLGTGFSRFLFFTVLVSLVYTLKFLILKISGWLFNLEREMSTYIFNIFLINNCVGIALVPVIALLAYNQWLPASTLILTGAILIGMGYVYRSVRGILIGFSVPGFSFLYLLLFLATFEIAPLIVIIRLIL